MDVEVEMVESSKEKDGIVAAEDLETITVNPSVQRQNTNFGLALVSILLGLSVFLVYKVYMSPGELDTQEYYQPGGGEVSNEDTKAKVSEVGRIKTHKGHGNTEDWMKQNIGKRDKNHSKDGHEQAMKVKKWKDANVTLHDGKKYEIVEQLVHDPNAFLEGLTFADGRLWESTGLTHQSTVRELNPATGEVISKYPMDDKYFGEGLTYANGKLIQLTYKAKTGFIYDASDLSMTPSTFQFSSTRGEGWGLTYDSEKNELIMSDGSEYLHFWDADTFQQKRKVKVTRQSGQPARNLNELELWRGMVLADIWFQDVICVIDKETGAVEKEYDFSTLWPKGERRKAGADVLNGIAISDDPDIVYVTGKNWDRMFKVRLSY